MLIPDTFAPIRGRIYSVLLAPLTAHVVIQVDDVFMEAFVSRTEAEKLRVGHEVIASPSPNGTSIQSV